MKKILYPAIMATLVLSSAYTLVVTGNYKVKEESYAVKFTSSKFEGTFKGLKSDLYFEESNLAVSKISASIESASVNTGNGMRNKHAAQGLGADQYPTISFVSTSIEKKGEAYEALGKLTIKDVTKEIKLPFTFTPSAEGGVFDGKFSVVPSEYHVDKSGTPSNIDISLTIPVTK